MLRGTQCRFADQTATNPAYLQLGGEVKKGHFVPNRKVFDMDYPPMIKLQTTVNGAYTTGGTTITFTSGSGFPSTGTIYIGGNKVSYTAKSTNDFTIPSATPSIDDGATVRGEVIELSREPEGSALSFEVQDPDTEYEVDYDESRVMLLDNAFFSEITNDTRLFRSNYFIRVYYMHAWHDLQQDATIPDEIVTLVNMIAARRLMGSVVAKANITGLDDFEPSMVNVDEKEIKAIMGAYKIFNVSTSMYNKQSLS